MSFPILDYNMAIGTSTQQMGFALKLGDALKNDGVAVLTKHGLPPSLLTQARRAAADLFTRPDRLLTKYHRADVNGQRGFTPFGVEKGVGAENPDQKRYWHVGRDDNTWPNAEVSNFQDVMTELYNTLDGMSVPIAMALDRYPGIPPKGVSKIVTNGPSLLRVLHYPPVDGEQLGIRAAEQNHVNLFTLLPAATAKGLQVKTVDNRWIAVNQPPESIVVIPGDMLELYTKGAIKPTPRRVVNPANGTPNCARYAYAFFVHPRPEVILTTNPPTTAGEFLRDRLQEIGHRSH
jgi:isopenicillin N synthase-like dioxygenase